MSCQYCGDTHSVFDPCPEMLAATQATVQKHTLGTHDPVTIKQLEESVRVVESLMKTARWTLISPNGEVWTERDPKKLVAVLLTKVTYQPPTQNYLSSFRNQQEILGRRNLKDYVRLSQTMWEVDLVRLHPDVRFTTETGDGSTYGEPGTVTAHTGDDMQANVVGVWVPGSHCSIDGNDYGVVE